MMNLKRNKVYKVLDSNKAHAGKVVVFDFMGGPDDDCAVCYVKDTATKRYRDMISVDPKDLEEFAPDRSVAP